jgi:hypothetical protein
MEISSSSTVDSMARLLESGPQAEAVAQMALLRKTLDAAATQSLDLIQSMLPHLGKHVDARV